MIAPMFFGTLFAIMETGTLFLRQTADSGRAWPAMPPSFVDLAARAAALAAAPR